MILYLCEKPSQAKDIARILKATEKRNGCFVSPSCTVTWCFGHLLEMSPPDAYNPTLKQWHFSTLPILPEWWKLGVKSSARKQFNVIKGLLKQTQHLIIATDADREGETIAREIIEQCGWQGRIERLWLSALDDSSIHKGLAQLRPGIETEPLYQAGLGRARADWLVGMNLTRAYTLIGQQQGLSGVLSVGRVQTPTLNLIVSRDHEIDAFVASDYFELIAQITTANGQFHAKWIPAQDLSDSEGRCLSKQAARNVAQRIEGQTATIVSSNVTRQRQSAPLPFDLSTLQQSASKRWGMGAQEVLDTVQALYETHKAVTYPRTDCSYLPESQFSEASAILQNLSSSSRDYAELIGKADPNIHSRAWNDKKITAHHAIIPTHAAVDRSRMTPVELKLYDMICLRYLAQFYPDYEYDKSIIELECKGEQFIARGNIPRIEGWKVVFGKLPKDEDEPITLPSGPCG